MPRQSLSRSDRAASVRAAASDIVALIQRAEACEKANGANDPRTLSAWEAVETNGATIHRQARLLAGKSRGG